MITRLFRPVALSAIVFIAMSFGLVRAWQSPRFDELVREDFFAGLGGDEARFQKAMKLCEDTLARQPKHAEAMVWHGSGLLWLAGQSYEKQDLQRGADLWTKGLKEMNDALALEPDNVGVLIPRGATFLEASKHVPIPDMQQSLLRDGLAAYEKTLTLQQSYFKSLSVHAKGELLIGLADGWDRAGDKVKARLYYERILKDCPDSSYAERAKKWLQ